MSAYGFIISFAIFITVVLVEKKAKMFGYKHEVVWDLMIVSVVGGVLGARAYHVVSEWDFYSQHPERILQIWNGGLALFGALVGGFVSMNLYAKQKSIKLLPYIDLVAVALPLAQAIGRFGNFFNQELYGLPTNLPWKLYINPENRLRGYESIEFFHPLFAYEIILNLILFSILNRKLAVKQKLVGTGYFIWFYLAGYMTIRFLLEFLRLESWNINGINVAQVIAVSVILLAVNRLRKLRVK